MGAIWRYRELLAGLVRKELKVKYKNSALGFFWSMLNPALYLVVFYVVFVKILRAGIPEFPIYLLSGLLVWNLFSTSLSAATGSVVGNSAIVKKVAFPREILAMASVGASLVHFFLQAVVLLGALAVFRHTPSFTYMALLPVALVTLL
ncbi:MAG: ABC transporter permease, partial [Acidimicrobiales bacterium]